MCTWLNSVFCLFPCQAQLSALAFYTLRPSALFFWVIWHWCVFLFASRCAPGFLGEYCQHKDPCQPGYCLNGGNCSVSMSAGVPVPGSATCSCPLGYTGQHCQIPLNSTCYPNNPCANRGLCTLLPFDKYKCECARGWTGKKMWLFLATGIFLQSFKTPFYAHVMWYA